MKYYTNSTASNLPNVQRPKKARKANTNCLTKYSFQAGILGFYHVNDKKKQVVMPLSILELQNISKRSEKALQALKLLENLIKLDYKLEMDFIQGKPLLAL